MRAAKPATKATGGSLKGLLMIVPAGMGLVKEQVRLPAILAGRQHHAEMPEAQTTRQTLLIDLAQDIPNVPKVSFHKLANALTK